MLEVPAGMLQCCAGRLTVDLSKEEWLMTNQEMQKAMEFIVEIDARTAITLDRLSKKVNAVPVTQDRSEKRWKRTQERLRALLVRAKKTERKISAPRRKSRPLRKTAADRRLEALAELVERQISEGRNGKP